MIDKDMDDWVKHIVDEVCETLKNCPEHNFGNKSKDLLSKQFGAQTEEGAWQELGPVSIDVWFERDGKTIAVETEVSALDASHDLLKLAYTKPDLAILVLRDADWENGPQRKTFKRIVKRIEALRSCPKNGALAQAFRSLRIVVVGIKYSDDGQQTSITPEAFT